MIIQKQGSFVKVTDSGNPYWIPIHLIDAIYRQDQEIVVDYSIGESIRSYTLATFDTADDAAKILDTVVKELTEKGGEQNGRHSNH